jgi:hypothetical protein
MVTPVGQGRVCDGCGVEMTWTPVLVGGRRYCCALCAGGADCNCGYVLEEEEEGPLISDR